MEQTLEYLTMVQGGYVIYKDGKNDIKLFFEYGSGNCVVLIFIPTEEEWTTKTGRPMAERNDILTFVAEQAIRDQGPNSYYELSDTMIEIFSKNTIHTNAIN
jgi:poly-D-alanine transfer protein DltD